MAINVTAYHLEEVEKLPESIYCYHDAMGEEGIPAHSHSKHQLLYTEGGLVHVKVEGTTYFLPARHYMWIPAQLQHSIHPSTANVIMRNLYFPRQHTDPNFAKAPGIYPVNDLLLQMIMFSKQWDGHITPKEKAAYSFSSAIANILPQLSINKLPLMLPMAKDKRLGEILTYMGEEMHQGLKLPDLAQQFGYSERSLSRLFKSDLGMSFVQYHTIQRMLKALNLLLDKRMRIKEIAMLVGYNSVPTFSATFSKTLGINASAYTNKNNNA